MYRSSPFRSTLNTGYIKLWTCVALDQCKSWTPFGHFCPYFHTPYTLLCPKDEFTFTFRRGLIWKIDNPSTTLSLAPGIFDNPYKGAESAGCQKQQFEDISPTNNGCFPFVILVFRGLIPLIIKAPVKISWDSSNDSRTTYRVTELVEEVTPAVQFTVSLPPSWVLREWNCFSLRAKSLPLKKSLPPQKKGK